MYVNFVGLVMDHWFNYSEKATKIWLKLKIRIEITLKCQKQIRINLRFVHTTTYILLLGRHWWVDIDYIVKSRKSYFIWQIHEMTVKKKNKTHTKTNLVCLVKNIGDFVIFLWPSHKIWTLLIEVLNTLNVP